MVSEFKRNVSEAPHPLFYGAAQWAIKKFLAHNGGVNVIGFENFPDTNRLLVTAEHDRKIDPFVIGAVSVRSMRSMAKKELWGREYKHAVGPVISLLGAFPVVRNSLASRAALEKSMSILEDEMALLVFLKGTREDGVAKDGLASLSLKTGSPILPIGLSTEVTPKGRPIQCIFGEVIAVDAMKNTKPNRKIVTAEIATVIHDLKQQAIRLDADGAGVPNQITYTLPKLSEVTA